MPIDIVRAVIEIDEIYGRHSGAQKWNMIIFDQLLFIDEILAITEPRGSIPDDIVDPSDRIAFAANIEIAVTDHIEQDERFDIADLARVAQTLRHVSGAVSMIGALPIDIHRLFAV